jgi:peptidoglycan/xylan/chitin deacetylase (PgdA/CDA1 family)
MVLYENARRCGLGNLSELSRRGRSARFDFSQRERSQITFFIVGRDASIDSNLEPLQMIADAGHEIANHSFNHEPWLHLYTKEELTDEFQQTEDALARITKQKLIGFRGPGYSLSPTVLEVLAERGYQYDCSTLPTYIGPLARAYYFMASPEMSAEEKEKSEEAFRKVFRWFSEPETISLACSRPRTDRNSGHNTSRF